MTQPKISVPLGDVKPPRGFRKARHHDEDFRARTDGEGSLLYVRLAGGPSPCAKQRREQGGPTTNTNKEKEKCSPEVPTSKKFVCLFFHPIYYLRPSILSLLVVAQIRGDIEGSSPPLPTAVRALHFNREKISALSSLVDSRRIVRTRICACIDINTWYINTTR